jgi:hypothetical protein
MSVFDTGSNSLCMRSRPKALLKPKTSRMFASNKSVDAVGSGFDARHCNSLCGLLLEALAGELTQSLTDYPTDCICDSLHDELTIYFAYQQTNI